MSIVRIGLAETKDFADGYDAIFGKKETKASEAKPEDQKAPATEASTTATVKPEAK